MNENEVAAGKERPDRPGIWVREGVWYRIWGVEADSKPIYSIRMDEKFYEEEWAHVRDLPPGNWHQALPGERPDKEILDALRSAEACIADGLLSCKGVAKAYGRAVIDELRKVTRKMEALPGEVERLREELQILKLDLSLNESSLTRWRETCGQATTLKSQYWKALLRIASVAEMDVPGGDSAMKAIGIEQAAAAKIKSLEAENAQLNAALAKEEQRG